MGTRSALLLLLLLAALGCQFAAPPASCETLDNCAGAAKEWAEASAGLVLGGVVSFPGIKVKIKGDLECREVLEPLPPKFGLFHSKARSVEGLVACQFKDIKFDADGKAHYFDLGIVIDTAGVRRFLKASGGRLPYCGQKRGYLHGYRYTEGAVRPDSFQRIVKGCGTLDVDHINHLKYDNSKDNLQCAGFEQRGRHLPTEAIRIRRDAVADRPAGLEGITLDAASCGYTLEKHLFETNESKDLDVVLAEHITTELLAPYAAFIKAKLLEMGSRGISKDQAQSAKMELTDARIEEEAKRLADALCKLKRQAPDWHNSHLGVCRPVEETDVMEE